MPTIDLPNAFFNNQAFQISIIIRGHHQAKKMHQQPDMLLFEKKKDSTASQQLSLGYFELLGFAVQRNLAFPWAVLVQFKTVRVVTTVLAGQVSPFVA